MSQNENRTGASYRATIPADVDKPDRILAGLNARQLAILAAAAVLVWAGYQLAGRLLPLPVLLVLAAPVVLLAVVLALGQRDGLPGDRFAVAALRHLLQPTRRVAAPAGLTNLPAPLAQLAGPRVAALALPIRGVDSAGILDLGAQGAALLARASSVGFALRAPAEQDALVASFGRFLNALSHPVQVVVRAERVDLRGTAAELERTARMLPHPALEAAAREHAAFLRELSSRRDLFHREVLLVLRHAAPADVAAQVLRRRAEDAAALLGGSGIALHPLDGSQALAALLRAADPEAPPPPAGAGTALPDEPTRGRT